MLERCESRASRQSTRLLVRTLCRAKHSSDRSGGEMFHRTVAVAMFAGLLASCASQPVPDAQTRAVPPDRISAPKYLDPAPNTGTVTVKRDSGFMGGGCAFQRMV